MLPPVSRNWQLIYLDLKKFYKFLTKSLRDLKLVCEPAINEVSTLVIGTKLTAAGMEKKKKSRISFKPVFMSSPNHRGSMLYGFSTCVFT
jgi:hypothetical protein